MKSSVWRKSLIYRDFSKRALTGSSPVSRSFILKVLFLQGFLFYKELKNRLENDFKIIGCL
nr:MAG TPA: hypothetical protein [Caudoviricetes sp.]